MDRAELPVIYLARHGEIAWSLTGQHTGLTVCGQTPLCNALSIWWALGEKVRKVLTALRMRNIIQITSDSILISDRRALENMLESKAQIEPVLRDRPGEV